MSGLSFNALLSISSSVGSACLAGLAWFGPGLEFVGGFFSCADKVACWAIDLLSKADPATRTAKEKAELRTNELRITILLQFGLFEAHEKPIVIYGNVQLFIRSALQGAFVTARG